MTKKELEEMQDHLKVVRQYMGNLPMPTHFEPRHAVEERLTQMQDLLNSWKVRGGMTRVER